MLKSDLNPPRQGINADPILYGIAAALAELFPPVDPPAPCQIFGGRDAENGPDGLRESSGEGGEAAR